MTTQTNTSESRTRNDRCLLLGLILVLYTILVLSFSPMGFAQAEEITSSQQESDAVVTQSEQSLESAMDELVSEDTFGVFNDHIKLQLFDSQQLLNLPTNTAYYYFSIPLGMTLGSGTLNLRVTSSDTLIDELSAISVDINGNRIDTVPINSIGTNGNGWWVLEIPAEYLKVGATNELSLTTAHRSIEGDCADIDNPSNWVGIEASSFFDVQVVSYPKFTLSNVFNVFYDSVLAGGTLSGEFVLAQGSENTLLYDGALTLASAAGTYKTDANNINFCSRTGISEEVSSHSIFLGWEDDWASLFPDRQLHELTMGQGYLEAGGTSDAPGVSQLLISGADDEGFARAVALAATPTYFKQLSGTSTTVTSDVSESKQLELSEDGVYSFEDLGFDTVSLAGAFHQTASFTITQPNNVQCGPSSTITIKFNHSKALQADRSLLTVKINDVEIDSIQLSDSNATDGSITVTIPEEARNKTTIRVTVDVYNYIGKIDCSKDYYDVAWTVIESTSSVFFDPSDMRLRPRLSEFLQFNLWRETPDSKMVLRSHDLSDAALSLAVRVGQKNATSFDFESKSLDDPFTEVDKENNIIYLGSVSQSSLPDEIQNSLAVVPQSDGTFRIAEGAPFINETLVGKVIFQVIRSPWNYDKYIYVITYPDGNENLAAEILQDGDMINSFSGTISCVDSDGTISSYDAFANMEGENAPLSLETVKYKVYERFGIPLWWLVGGVVLLLVLVFLIIRLARRRAQFKQMEQKMKEANEEIEEIEKLEEIDEMKPSGGDEVHKDS